MMDGSRDDNVSIVTSTGSTASLQLQQSSWILDAELQIIPALPSVKMINQRSAAALS